MKTKASQNLVVSVIVPVYNEEANIKDLLISIKEQSYNNIEVVVGDDCSTDSTVKLVRLLGGRLKLKVVVVSAKVHKERGFTRNQAAKKANGEFLLFIDADMRLSKTVIEDCVNKIKQDYDGVIIPEVSVGEGYWANCRALEKRCYIGDDLIEAVRFFKNKNFWKVNGWDELMISGEDWDLTRRYRVMNKIGRIDAPIYHYEGSLNFWHVLRKKYYYAKNSKRFLSQNSQSVFGIVKFVIRPAYLRNWRILICDPLHLVGMILLKSCEYIAGIYGMLRLNFFKSF